MLKENTNVANRNSQCNSHITADIAIFLQTLLPICDDVVSLSVLWRAGVQSLQTQCHLIYCTPLRNGMDGKTWIGRERHAH